MSLGTRAVNRLRDLYAHVCHRTRRLNAEREAYPRAMHNQAAGALIEQLEPRIMLSATLFSDSFDSVTPDAANWVNVAGATIDDMGVAEPSASYSLHLDGDPDGGDSIVSRAMDLSSMSEAVLSYSYQRTGDSNSPETGDDLILEYWDGEGWIELDRQLGSGADMTNYAESRVMLTEEEMHDGFQFRFRNIATPGPFDDWFVDNVSLTTGNGPRITDMVPGEGSFTLTFDQPIDPETLTTEDVVITELSPSLVGSYDTSGQARDVAVSGMYAYVADGYSGLQIFNISDPASPSLVGNYETSDYSVGVAVSGTLAYVADGESGLLILDVSDPSLPSLVGSYNTSEYACGVALSGTLAYVADDVAGLQIIDISDPSSPALVGSYDTSGVALDVTVSGPLAYIADYDAGLQIVDISDPSSPVLVGSYDTSGNAWDVAVSGTYVYVADQAAGMQIIDISDPSSPALIGNYATDYNTYGVTVSGPLAYLADGGAGLQILDISDPASPVLVGNHDSTNATLRVTVSGELAYVADWENGLQIIDVMIKPTGVTQINASTYRVDLPEGMADGVYPVFVSPNITDMGGVKMDQDGDGIDGESSEDVFAFDMVIDTTPPVVPGDLTFQNNTGSSDPVTSDSSLLFTWSEPQDLWGISGYEYRWDNGDWVETDETGAFISTSEGEHTFDVRALDLAGNVGDPASLTVAVDLTAPEAPANLRLDGSVFLWDEAADANGIWKYEYRLDGGDWTETTELSAATGAADGVSVLFEVRAIDLAGHIGPIASETLTVDYGPQVISHSPTGLVGSTDSLTVTFNEPIDPATFTADDVTILYPEPTLVGSYNTSGYAQDVTISGTLAYVADGRAGLYVLDISDPTSPVLVGSYDTSGYAYDVTVSGTLAYVADVNAGLHILDISDPSSPVLVGSYDTSGDAYDVAVSGTLVYVADRSAGLQIIDISDPSSPILVGNYDTSGSAVGVTVSGTLAYVADGSAGLQIIDISDPSSPVLVGNYDTSGDAYDVAVSGTLAYVADYYSGLQIIDISDPASPVLVGSYDTSDYARGVTVSGTMAYVANGSAGLHIIDISDPSSPVLVGSYDTSSNALDVTVSGTLAYVADGSAGLQIIQLVEEITGVTGITAVDATTYRIDLADTLPDGYYTVQVGPNANDLAGNTLDQDGDGIGDEAYAFSFTTDTTPPMAPTDLTFADHTGATDGSVTADTSLTFTWLASTDASGVAGYEYRIDEGDWTATTDLTADFTVAEGEHTFEVRALDMRGYVGDPASLTVAVDLTAPEAPGNLRLNGSVFHWDEAADANGIWKYEYRLDGGDWTETTDLSAATGAADGASVLCEVRAIDLAGHAGAIASETITVMLTYTITDGKVTITDCDEAYAGELTIPDTIEGLPVTAIGDNAFLSCRYLTSITIPDSVTSIGERAFYICAGLTSVTIPNSVTSIGNEAFRYCINLTRIMIPDSVTSIGNSAFRECFVLTSIVVDPNNTNFSSVDDVLFNKDQTTLIACPGGRTDSYTISDSVTSIGAYAFDGCDGLTSITIPDSVTSIGAYAFDGCNGLTSIRIPDSVTTIGYCAFANSDDLIAVTFEGNAPQLENNAFSGGYPLRLYYYEGASGFDSTEWDEYAKSVIEVTALTISGPASVQEGAEAQLTCGMTFEDGAIGDATSLVQWQTDGLGTVSDDGVLTAGFVNEDTLRQITATLGNASGTLDLTVTDEGNSIVSRVIPGPRAFTDHSFQQQYQLIATYEDGTVVDETDQAVWECASPVAIVDAGLLTVTDAPLDTEINMTATLGGQTMDVTVTANYDISMLTYTIVGGMVAITDCDSSYTGEVIIPDIIEGLPVMAIGDDAFEYCDDLTSVTIPDGVTSIGNSAFRGCDGLASIAIPDSVTSIGHYAFYDCDGLTSVTIPDSVTSLGSRAFYGCDSLTSVTIGDSVTSLASSVFCGCANLTDVTIGRSVTAIEMYAFADCFSLESVTFRGNAVSFIERNSFPVSLPNLVVFCYEGAEFQGIRVDPNSNPYEYYPTLGHDMTSLTLAGPASVQEGQDVKLHCVATYEDGTSMDVSHFVQWQLDGLGTISADGVLSPNFTDADISGQISVTTWNFSDTLDLTVTDEGNSVSRAEITGKTVFTEDSFEQQYQLMVTYEDGTVVDATDQAVWECGWLGADLTANVLTVTNAPADTEIDISATFGGQTARATAVAGFSLSRINYVIVDGEVTILNYNTNVSPRAFIPDTIEGLPVTTIAERAFYFRRNLTSVTIPDSVTSIGARAFYDCYSLASVTIGNGVTTIGDSAFLLGRALKSVTIGDSVTSIGDSAFALCRVLRNVTIPDSVTSIGERAFGSCEALASATFEGHAPTMGDLVFSNVAAGFTIYYYEGATGFTSPTWEGYASQTMPDDIPPAIDGMAAYPDPDDAGQTVVVWDVMDNIGVDHVDYVCGGLSGTVTGNSVSLAIPEGDFTFTLTAYDAAGNSVSDSYSGTVAAAAEVVQQAVDVDMGDGEESVGIVIDEDADGTPDVLVDPTTAEEFVIAHLTPTGITTTPSPSDPDAAEVIVDVDKTDGWIFVNIADPFNGQRELLSIFTADGREINPDNWWIDDDGRICMLDDPAVTYELDFENPATIEGRHVFYNNSYFDGNDAGAGAGDDGAVATDKTALLPGGTANASNYTNYSKGINGIIVDVADLAAASLSASDFAFTVGNSADPSSWSDAPAPTSITVREGAGANGSDRVTVLWADNAIEKQWLQVTVLANANTGLEADDVFYFGNAVGDDGQSDTATVDLGDVMGAMNNPHGSGDRAGITDAYDYDRNGLVDLTDVMAAMNNGTSSGTRLQLISAPLAPEPLSMTMGMSEVLSISEAVTVPAAIPAVVDATESVIPAPSTWMLEPTRSLLLDSTWESSTESSVPVFLTAVLDGGVQMSPLQPMSSVELTAPITEPLVVDSSVLPGVGTLLRDPQSLSLDNNLADDLWTDIRIDPNVVL